MMNTEQQNLPPQHSHPCHTGEQSSQIVDNNNVPPHHRQPHHISEMLQTINNDNLLPQHCCPHQPHRVDGMNFVIGLILALTSGLLIIYTLL